MYSLKLSIKLFFLTNYYYYYAVIIFWGVLGIKPALTTELHLQSLFDKSLTQLITFFLTTVKYVLL